jgi:hypothetical protein
MSGCQPRPKWVPHTKNLSYGFFWGSTYRFRVVILHHSKLIYTDMKKEQLNDIQQSLNWIRSQAEEADAAAKVEVLALLNATSQSVIQMAKKLTAPKAKTKVVTRYKDKPKQKQQKIIKPGKPPETATDLPVTPFQAIKPQSPIAPLSNQQATD